MSGALSAQTAAQSVRFFNSTYYLNNNPDVLAAVTAGRITAFQHFQLYGAKEGRSPTSLFNASTYLANNADIANAVGSGAINSAWDHFANVGIVEGRSNGGFSGTFNSTAYLAANPDVAAAVSSGTSFRSAYEHFLLYGANEGRAAFNTAGQSITTNPGSTFTLTTGADNLTGTSGNDTFGGGVSATAASNTLTAVDTVNGGAGTDRLVLQIDGNYAGGATITNIEEIVLTSAGAISSDVVFNTQGITGLTLVGVNSSVLGTVGTNGESADVTFTNVGSAANVLVRSPGAFSTTTVTYADTAVAGTANAVRLTLDGLQTAHTVNLNNTTTLTGATGIETLTIENLSAQATGTSATVTTNATQSLTTVNFTGSVAMDITLGTNIQTTATTLNASTATAGISVSGLGVAIHTFTGGSGADTVNFGGNFDVNDVVNGGAGRDTLASTTANFAAFTTTATNVSNVEVIRLTNDNNGVATVNLALFGATSVRMAAQTDTTVTTVNNIATGETVRFDGAQNGTVLNVRDATLPGTADTLTLDLRGAGTYQTTIAGVETITANANNSTGTSTLTLTDTALTTLNLVNSTVNAFNTGILGAAVSTVNASGVTGNGQVTITLNGTATTGATVTGTGGVDIVTGSNQTDIINVGAGNDDVTAGAGADRINVGAGTDTVTQAAVGASGTYAAPTTNTISTATFDVITGFAVGDLIQLTAATRTVTSANTLVASIALDNTAVFVRGTYDATANTFVGAAAGTDSLFIYDADATAVTVAVEAMVLVGLVNVATQSSTVGGLFTLA